MAARAKNATPKRLPPAARRTQLAEAAMEVAAEQGYARLSLDDVAERAGVTRNLLYHYFPRGRLDVFLAAVERAGDELTGDLIFDTERPVAEKLAANTMRSAEHAAGPTAAWRVARHARAAAEPEIVALRNRYRDAVVAGMALNHFGTEDPPPVVLIALRAFLDYLQTALDEWRESDVDRDAVLELLERTLIATVVSARAAA
jgi:AcrR family transcriptional regulator